MNPWYVMNEMRKGDNSRSLLLQCGMIEWEPKDRLVRVRANWWNRMIVFYEQEQSQLISKI